MANIRAIDIDENVLYLKAEGEGTEENPHVSVFTIDEGVIIPVDTQQEQALTDAELRATAVVVDTQQEQALTDTELRAAPVTVDTQQEQALTDVELRAAPVVVDTQLTQALTDTELRATPVEVTGDFYQDTQPVSLTTLPVLPTGNNTIGSIANTVFAATQQGTWNVNNISGTISLPTGAATASNQKIIPGFAIPEHDTIVITEDANGELVSVSYLLNTVEVRALDFTYSGYTFVAPNKTTTIERT